MTNHVVSNRADLREHTKTMSRHGDRRGQIPDFRGSFETINWLYLLFKCGIKTKTHFEWLLWHWSSLGQLNLEPTRPLGLVGCKVPTDLVKISVKEATHMGFYHITQWTLWVGSRKHNGGTSEVEASLKFIHNVCKSTHFFTWRPIADPCASLLWPRQCVCLPPVSFEWPVSDQPPRRPLCNCFEHDQNFTATMASIARSEHPLCHLWRTKATFWPPLCLQLCHSQFCGCTREAHKGRNPCLGVRWSDSLEWIFHRV